MDTSEDRALAPAPASAPEAAGEPERPPKDLNMAYALAILGWVTPAAGLHRFYLNQPILGVLYLLTWGLLGIGTLVDLIRMQKMVNAENRRLMPPPGAPAGLLPAELDRLPPEQVILRVAHAHDGAVTVAMVALHSPLSMARAERELERLRAAGHCVVDVNEQGAKIYTFPGFGGTDPLEI